MLSTLEKIFDSASGGARRPVVNDRFESNLSDLYIIGDLAGAPVVKLAMEQGHELAARLASLPDARGPDPAVWDLAVIGAGAAGLNCALEAQARGMRVVVLEKGKLANTIEDFPEGKWIYAEPDGREPRGALWLEESTKEELVERWCDIVQRRGLDVRTDEPVTSLVRHKAGGFEVKTPNNTYPARRAVLAIGQRGNPRRLGVPGEESERVHHRLYSPRHYEGERILVVGGGNSAAEAALLLAERNHVTLSYRGREFTRLFKDNARKLREAEAAGRIEVLRECEVRAFEHGEVTLTVQGKQQRRPCDRAFVLIGAEAPAAFLKSLGIRLENDWSGSPLAAALLTAGAFAGMALHGGQNPLALVGALIALGALFWRGLKGCRWSWLGLMFFVCYAIYGIKKGPGHEFWPYRGWGWQVLSFGGRGWSFWYTVIYTLLMTFFGIQALLRWGVRRKDRFQIWRYVCLIGFQWVFFFLIPEFLFQAAVKHQWIGEKLVSDPNFAQDAWRSYGLVYAWPLFFHTFFGDPHVFWVVWGALLTLILVPVLVLFHGKRYCSWVCGCGGLAETLGDRWRHLAPKGRRSIQLEQMGSVVFVLVAAVTAMVLLRDAYGLFRGTAPLAQATYSLMVDLWLVGIIPVMMYPFLGGKIWCRYWCPLARMMEWFARLYTRWGVSRFAIRSNDKCIACGECTRYCQVGIDVMSFAMKQQTLDNVNSSCIGCGICVTVCPMNVLSFGRPDAPAGLVQIQPARLQ